MVRETVRQIGTHKKRQYGKYAIDMIEEKDCTNMLGVIAILRHRSTNMARRRLFLLVMLLLAGRVEEIQRVRPSVQQPVERRYLRYLDADLQDRFTSNFRFRREDFPRLLRCLRIPNHFALENGSICVGEEALLIFLKIFSFPNKLIDVETFLGWESSRLSRIFNWISFFLYVTHRHRLEDYLDFHSQYLQASMRAMQAKKRRLHPQGLLNPRTENVAEDFDGLRFAVCRPRDRVMVDAHGQPVLSANGHIQRIDVQVQVYSGHVKVI
jgi:hypothetical protein